MLGLDALPKIAEKGTLFAGERAPIQAVFVELKAALALAPQETSL